MCIYTHSQVHAITHSKGAEGVSSSLEAQFTVSEAYVVEIFFCFNPHMRDTLSFFVRT